MTGNREGEPLESGLKVKTTLLSTGLLGVAARLRPKTRTLQEGLKDEVGRKVMSVYTYWYSSPLRLFLSMYLPTNCLTPFANSTLACVIGKRLVMKLVYVSVVTSLTSVGRVPKTRGDCTSRVVMILMVLWE